MSENESPHPIEARVAEIERRLELLDEAVFEAISALGRPAAPLHGDPHRRLMRIFCRIDRVSEDFLDHEPDSDEPGVTPPAEPRLRVVPEVP